MNKFLNIRISVDFYNLLNTHTSFQSNWKAISPAFFFLQRIVNLNDMNGGHMSEFSSTAIFNIFRPYFNLKNTTPILPISLPSHYLNDFVPMSNNGTHVIKKDNGDCGYIQYIQALEELKVIEINQSYYHADNKDQSFCKSYLVTSKGLDLLNSSNVDYLKALHQNKEVIRKNKEATKKRIARNTNSYSDYVLNYIADGLNHFDYDYGKAMATVTGSNWDNLTQQSATDSLISFKTRDFGTLKYNEADGRVFNEFVAMKSDLRCAFTYNKMERKAVIDIRACHATFFSSYILDYFITSTSVYPLPSHYLNDFVPMSISGSVLNHDTTTCSGMLSSNSMSNNGTHVIKKEMVEREHEKWLNLFTNDTIDPRDIIGLKIGRTKEEVKSALNESINGNKVYTKTLDWIKEEFPCLYIIWQTMNIKETGPNISKLYESQIMLNPNIFRLTEAQGIKLAYEYDGISVFSKDMGTLLIDKINYLVKQIKYIAREKYAINLVLKVDFINL